MRIEIANDRAVIDGAPVQYLPTARTSADASSPR
jgi:hypothetical protein